jgi:hypothetical protein
MLQFFFKYVTFIILTALAVFPIGLAEAAPSLVGSVTSFDCDFVTGWACDRNDANPLGVWVYEGLISPTNTILVGASANLNLGTGPAAYCGSDSRWFKFATPAQLKDGQNHTLYVYATSNDGNVSMMLDNCPKTIQCCPGGPCQTVCTNACVNGAKQCNGDGYQTCADYNSDGCTEWSSIVPCLASQTCSAGTCISTCSNECASSGLRQCNASGYQICGSYDSDPCLEWSSVVDCPGGQTCSAGACGANTPCVSHYFKKCDNNDLYWYNSCGGKEGIAQSCGSSVSAQSYRCSGTWIQRAAGGTCVNDACSGEPAWSNVQDCAQSGKICKEGVCIASDNLAPAISGVSPSGTIYAANTVLAVNTSEAAECRYNAYDKSFDAMTLPLATSDKKYHSVPLTLKNFGNYTYYVKCRDEAGNISPSSAKITFRYESTQTTTPPAPPNPPQPPAATDNKPPVVSNPSPSGDINDPATTISVSTDEKATCKYDIADTSYDSLENQMDASSQGTNHSRSIVVAGPGSYNYYVRCKDASANLNADSVRISFNYVAAQSGGPAISGMSPLGTVNQDTVALIVVTDKPSECRYSMADMDFDSMADLFTTSDGQTHQAVANLADYGGYNYYVRCKDNEGNKNIRSEVINFSYQNPDEQPAGGINFGNKETPIGPSLDCKEYKNGDSNGNCDATIDCICDPDCPAAPDSGADPDCSQAKAKTKTNGWIVALFAGLTILSAAAVATVIMRRRRQDQDEYDEENE